VREAKFIEIFSQPLIFSLLLSFLSQEKERRRARNGTDKISGEELPSGDRVPAFSFCDKNPVNPYFL
jgi:hypothetical protein